MAKSAPRLHKAAVCVLFRLIVLRYATIKCVPLYLAVMHVVSQPRTALHSQSFANSHDLTRFTPRLVRTEHLQSTKQIKKH